jgi:signal transduction histidine kinase/ActR/RegA family two-component response regulator
MIGTGGERFTPEGERAFRSKWVEDNLWLMRIGAAIGALGTLSTPLLVPQEESGQNALRLLVMGGAQVVFWAATFSARLRTHICLIAAFALAVSTGGFLFVLAKLTVYGPADAALMTVLCLFGVVSMFRLRLRDTLVHCALVSLAFAAASGSGAAEPWLDVNTLQALLVSTMVCAMAAGYAERRERTAFRLQLDLSAQLLTTEQTNDRLTQEISERQRAETALDEALAKAQRADRAKSDFLTMMSHDLRTPMNGIIGTIDLLKDSPLEEGQRALTAVLEGSANNLLELLNDILDLSRVERGTLRVEPLAVDLRVHAEKLLEPLRLRAGAKGIGLQLVTCDGLDKLRLADPLRLGQILGNLVHNAIKFTRAGVVTVRITRGEGTQVHYRVEDTGVGVTDEQRSALFLPFGRAQKKIAEHYGGAGLGLSIAHALVQRLGGTIGIAESAGGGATFWFDLPLAFAEDQTIPPRQPVELANDQLKLHVLLVEDNPINQRVATWLLDKLGCTYGTADDGEQALEQMALEPYDVVLMDCMMPRLNGLDCTARIRASDQPWATTPIIALTANVMKGEKERCLAAGMDYYLAKPIRLQQLRDTLGECQPSEPRVKATGPAFSSC